MLVEAYADKEEFYARYGDLGRGWGNMDHTRAPAGWDTGLVRLRREGDGAVDRETWTVAVAGPFPEIRGLTPSRERRKEDPVPGAVVATSSEGRVLVLFSNRDVRHAFDAIRELERDFRRLNHLTLEKAVSAIRAPYRHRVNIAGMRFSRHFEQDRQDAPDRREITLDMCESVRGEPLDMDAEDQPHDRTAYWGYIARKSRYLKVVVESDGEEITTAHWDRGFARRMKRREMDRP